MSEKIAAIDAAADNHWSVLDKNAKTAARTHEPVAGFFYELTAQRKTAMPRKHAVVFLRDSAFRVFNEHGQEQSPLPDMSAIKAGKGRVALEEGQTIANYEELTGNALFARCVARPGGYEVDPGDREAMVEFLKTAPTVLELPRSERVRDMTSDDDPDALPPEAVAKMMGAEDAINRAAIVQRDAFSMGA